ncbi:MAG TPA: alkaline phosphatase family protein [Kofleriaceae bacterium]|nr:alkaline phosphatase family protein [Kofleriaceae bacterium]
MRHGAVTALLIACHGTSGAKQADAPPVQSDGPTTPDASDAPIAIPIKHVVIVVKENHTFDNYFGSFPGADGISQIPTASGTMISPPHAPQNMPRDLCHDHPCALTDWAGGDMNGWEQVADASDNNDYLVYAQYQESDIPNYWAYARTFTLGDRFFADALAPSFPGHLFTVAAQAGWATSNPDNVGVQVYWGCDQGSGVSAPVTNQTTCQTENDFPCFDIPSIPDILPEGVDWKFYGSDYYVLPEIWSMFDAVRAVRYGPGWNNVVNENTFDDDVDNGRLPAVSWLVDQDLADEHPLVGSPCTGENWTVAHLNHIMQSPYWADTAILFTMDDFGGWYDHVPPPRQYGCDVTQPYGLGFRLPLLIISPYAKPGFIFHETSEQASIARFVERVFGATTTLSAMDPAAQDGQANDLFGAFDFTQQPLPPLVLQQQVCL